MSKRITTPNVTTNTNLNATPDINTPNIPLTQSLSREELAAYMLSVERHTDVIEKMMQSFMENQTTFMANFCNSMMSSFNNLSSTAKTLMEQHAASEIELKSIITQFSQASQNTTVANNNTVQDSAQELKSNTPILIQVDPAIETWKQNAYDVANKIAKQQGYGNGNTVIQHIYKRIKSKDGIDMVASCREYCKKSSVPSMSTINFISQNENLRSYFDLRANEMLNEYCPSCKKNSLTPTEVTTQTSSECSQTTVIDIQTHVTHYEDNSPVGSTKLAPEAYTVSQDASNVPVLKTTPMEVPPIPEELHTKSSEGKTIPLSIAATKIPNVVLEEMKSLLNRGCSKQTITFNLHKILEEKYDINFNQLKAKFHETYGIKTINRMYLLSLDETLMDKLRCAIKDFSEELDRRDVILAEAKSRKRSK